MAGKTTTTTPNGDVTSITVTPPTATVSFSRKNGLPGYSSEELSVFVQIPLDDVDSNAGTDKQIEQIAEALDPHVTALKAFVYNKLGTAFTVTNGVVVGETQEVAATPKRGGSKQPAAAKAAATTDDERDELFARLAGAEPKGAHWKAPDGETIFDNREGKKNPKSPDFKFADSGKGLWLDKAPTWFSGPGEGVSL